MNFIITGRPEFTFSLTDAQFMSLIRLSGAHYDATCRAASSLGGFIYGWGNIRTLGDPAAQLRATWRELDLCCKILEGAPQLEPDLYRVARELSISFRAMLGEADKWSARWVVSRP